jgi:hypothetical protein
VENPKKGRISEETKELIDKLLLEKLPLASIARITGVSERWLQNKKYEEVKREVKVSKKVKSAVRSQLHRFLETYSMIFIYTICPFCQYL